MGIINKAMMYLLSIFHDKDGLSENSSTEKSRGNEPPFNLSEYEKRIAEAAKCGTSELISNHSKNHSKIILENMVESASSCMLIYDRDLSGDLLTMDDNKLLKQFQGFLEKDINRRIEIIVDPSQNHNDNVVSELKKLRSKSLKIFQLNMSEFSKINYEYLDVPYFSVSDERAYRIEVKGGKERNAVACFNDQKMGSSLTTMFEKLKTISEPI